MFKTSPWTPVRVARARELWHQGKGRTQILDIMQAEDPELEATSNAVAGLIHRMKLKRKNTGGGGELL